MRALKRGLRTVSRWSLGVALLPVLWVLGGQLLRMTGALSAEGYKAWWLYAAGAAGYLAIERLIAKPMWLYVVGHELTHAVSGVLSGAKIYSLKATAKNGEVQLSKSNAFIALSPYVVPFYAVLVVALYAAAKRWWFPPAVAPSFQILLGASLAFHFSLTFQAVHGQQTDLKVLGIFLSCVLIAIGNALILAVLGVSLFTRTPTLKQFAADTTRETIMIWMKGFEFCKTLKRFNPPAAHHPHKESRKWTR